jgi:putative aminopeptidase FrvX
MDELLRSLIEVPGIPGYEERVSALIATRLPGGVETTTDTVGNLVATLGSGEPEILFVAHMDEIGFVVSEVREDGFLKLKPVGGIDPRTVFGRALRIVTGEGEITGVAGVVPPHLMRDRAKEMGEIPAVTDLIVDIGAKSLAEAEGLGVRLLDFAVLHKSLHVLNEKLWCARGLDDRAGCYVLLRALERLKEETLKGRVHFAFSVHSSPAALGAGPCLRVFDQVAIIPRAFTGEIRELAAGAGIPLQVIFSGGGTDVGAFQPEGPQVMPLAFPLRYTHSAVEMVHEDDIGNLIDLVCLLAKRYAGS